MPQVLKQPNALRMFLNLEPPVVINAKVMGEEAGYIMTEIGSSGFLGLMRKLKQNRVMEFERDKEKKELYTISQIDKATISTILAGEVSAKRCNGNLTAEPVQMPEAESEPEVEYEVDEIDDKQLVPYIEGHAQLIRNHHVMLDRDLASVYGVETRVLNQQRERNPEKFPDDFAFQLSASEIEQVTSHFVMLQQDGEWFRHPPWAYTLEGCNMAATVLNTPKAVERAVKIIRTFSDLERMAHGEQPKQPRFEEMMIAFASGFKTFRGDIDQLAFQKADKVEVDDVRKNLQETRDTLAKANEKIQRYQVEINNLHFQQERHQQLDKDKHFISALLCLGTRLRTDATDDRKPEWAMWGSLVSTLNGGRSVSYEKLSLRELEVGLRAARIVVAKRAKEYPEGVRNIENSSPRLKPMLYEAMRVVSQLELTY
ncbi:ORF6N domain-containing protein [bacterium]|nr:ORF6N domain-containing protein [bacterium]